MSEQPGATNDYPPESVGSLMEPPIAVFPPRLTVGEAVGKIRELAAGTRAFTYGYITDDSGVLVRVITMRDMLLQRSDARLESFMLRQPFTLPAASAVRDAMRLTLDKHYPSYPVCDETGKLIGVIRGSRMFEQQNFEIIAQAGRMVGVEKE